MRPASFRNLPTRSVRRALPLLLLVLTLLLSACRAPLPPDTPAGDPPSDNAVAQPPFTDLLTVFGRTPVGEDGLQLYWTNSGFSFAFFGTGATATIRTDTTSPIFTGYCSVYIDGAPTPSAILCIDHSGSYTLAEQLPLGEHTIELRKRNEAALEDSALLTLEQLHITDGTFRTPPAPPPLTIEFIGDSITAGYGNAVHDGGNGSGFSTQTQDGTMTYATIAARSLHADARVLALSGICYATGTNRRSMYPYYLQCATLPGKSADTSYWDFSAHPSDVVVINLGTNDTAARIDGTPLTSEQYTEHAVRFLQLVRVHNPDAVIVWAYGMMTRHPGEAIAQAVLQCNEAGDDNVYFCELPTADFRYEGEGIGRHPSALSHLLSALTLSAFLAEHIAQAADPLPLLYDTLAIAATYLPAEHPLLAEAAALPEQAPDTHELYRTIHRLIRACRDTVSS